jgi:tetratricopeptide (TPR) repeat protein
MNLTGSSKEAINVFDKALSLNPDKFLRVKALLGKAFAYRNLRQASEAKFALAEAKKLSQQIGDSMNLEDIEQLEKEVKQISDSDNSNESQRNGIGPNYIR